MFYKFILTHSCYKGIMSVHAVEWSVKRHANK